MTPIPTAVTVGMRSHASRHIGSPSQIALPGRPRIARPYQASEDAAMHTSRLASKGQAPESVPATVDSWRGARRRASRAICQLQTGCSAVEETADNSARTLPRPRSVLQRIGRDSPKSAALIH